MKRTALTLWFVAVAILFAANSYVCFYNVRRLLEHSDAVGTARQTIIATESVLSTLKDAETGERGYLLTNDPAFLEPYEDAERRFPAEAAALRRLVDDDREEIRTFDRLRQTADQRLDALREAVRIRKQGRLDPDDELQRQKLGKGKMDQIRGLSEQLRATETRELQGRLDERNRSAGTATATLIGAGVINLLLLGAIAFAVRRDERVRAREIEQRVKAAEMEKNYLRVAEQYEERKRFAEALEALNARLEQSNRELQDFASVASHDLQEPLRKIQAFGDRLRKRFAAQLGPDGQDYLDRMHSAASRMATLIDDLLTFSRVTTKAQPFAPVDLSHVVNEVLADLETRVESSGGRVEIEHPLPTVEADALQMRQLFQNLIANGLKFRRPDMPPVVRVRAAILPPQNGSGPMCEIRVADNGIGFDEKYLDRIFNVFQRLHGRNEYEGTGIGLAVVRKIAERHGGRVTAHAHEGEGATFVITIPVSHAPTEVPPVTTGAAAAQPQDSPANVP
jgi:signal transduction histidine kinase